MEKGNPESEGIHLLYKNLGESPLDTIVRFKKFNPEYQNIPMTYAGRLDPMAEGLLLVLSGEKTKEKDKYLNLDKTYIFKILWGFSTDTLDILGLQLSQKEGVPTESEIVDFLEKSKGKFEQKYPAYSSKPIEGEPLWELAREGRLASLETPSHTVEIYSAKFLQREFISKEDVSKNIEEKIGKVSGDFRQSEILNGWRKILSETSLDTFALDGVEMTVSSGFYIRQFVSDLALKLGFSGVTFHIKRTKVGDYKI